MKIVYYLPSLHAPGGLERIITFKANYFAEHFENYEVFVVTSEQVGMKPFFELSPKVKHIDLDVTFDWPFQQSRLSKILKYPARYRRFKKRFTELLCELKPDITISTLRREMHFLHAIPDGSVKIGEFHVTRNSYGWGGNDLLRKRWERNFVLSLKKFNRIVLLTHEETSFWPELNNTTVIPNPIITPMKQQSDCTSHQVIAAGRYAVQKGFDLLIEAWALVVKQHPDWTLCIYGDGSLRRDFEIQIERLGLIESCLLKHTVSDIESKYCESSIFVLSSRFEGFGMVITEAMGCGVPPVSFACPCGPRDIITDGYNGLLAENGNIAQLAHKICRLIANKEERQQLGKQAYIDSKKYQMENIGQQWKELFESLTHKQ